jgi:hypothetical protein
MPGRRGLARVAGARGAAGMVLMAVVLAAPLAACSARPVPGKQAAPRHAPIRSVPAPRAAAASQHRPRLLLAAFQTKRTFHLGAGHATSTFTFREPDGVILRNRLTVPPGVRVVVDARIPGTADVKIWSWARRYDPSLSCRRHGAVDVCTQGEQWCPMPQATWHFRLVKLSGPAGPVRFDYVVAAPPRGFSG